MITKKKEYWYISDKGDLAVDVDENKYKDRFRKQIGNCFSNVYEADKFLTQLESKKEVQKTIIKWIWKTWYENRFIIKKRWEKYEFNRICKSFYKRTKRR